MKTTNSLLSRAFQIATMIAIAIPFASSVPTLASAKKHKAPAQPTDSNYVACLSIANRFLAAWQSNDQAAAMPLITTRAKEQSTEEGVDQIFSGSSDRAFEIARGHLLRPGRYQFSIVLLQADDSGHTRRRFAELIIITTGKNDCAVDKLP
jgi:hypothetical protein